MDERRPKDLRNVWQSQETEVSQMSLEQIRRKAKTLQSKVGSRNRREYVAVVLVVLAGVFFMVRSHSVVVRASVAAQIAGVLYVAYQLHRRASAQHLPQECGLECCLDFHRKQLERQHDALSSVWQWYLGPLVPGLVVLIAGKEIVRSPGEPHHWAGFVMMTVICTAVFWGIGKLNGMAARGLQQQIDELNAPGEYPQEGAR